MKREKKNSAAIIVPEARRAEPVPSVIGSRAERGALSSHALQLHHRCVLVVRLLCGRCRRCLSEFELPHDGARSPKFRAASYRFNQMTNAPAGRHSPLHFDRTGRRRYARTLPLVWRCWLHIDRVPIAKSVPTLRPEAPCQRTASDSASRFIRVEFPPSFPLRSASSPVLLPDSFRERIHLCLRLSSGASKEGFVRDGRAAPGPRLRRTRRNWIPFSILALRRLTIRAFLALACALPTRPRAAQLLFITAALQLLRLCAYPDGAEWTRYSPRRDRPSRIRPIRARQLSTTLTTGCLEAERA